MPIRYIYSVARAVFAILRFYNQFIFKPNESTAICHVIT